MKGQSAIEFIVLFAAVFFFFLALLLVLQQRLGEEAEKQREQEFLKLALDVQNELRVALGASDGYERRFVVPGTIINADYAIGIDGPILYIYSEDGKNALSLEVPVANGQIVKGENVIRKLEGEIYLNS